MASRGGPAFVLVALCLLELALRGAVDGKRLVPAIFVFGDSTVDVGNNNFLPNSTADCRANYSHYGVDYRSHTPTGRFSNGYNLADQIAQNLGFTESPPAFQSLSRESIAPQMQSGGINFASGGSGLLNGTGKTLCTQVCSMTKQVEKFSSIVREIGNSTADLIISRSLVFISTGSNDLFEYADDATPKPNRNDTVFLQSLVTPYRNYLKELYEAGARKFSVVSPSLVGCCPSQLAVAQKKNDFDGLGCFGTANTLSRQLHSMLASMLEGLSLELPRMKYSLADSAAMAEPTLKGKTPPPGTNITVLDKACCGGAGRYVEAKCNATASLCQKRDEHLFWDGFHPTEKASWVAARGLIVDNGSYVHPINVLQLAELPP